MLSLQNRIEFQNKKPCKLTNKHMLNTLLRISVLLFPFRYKLMNQIIQKCKIYEPKSVISIACEYVKYRYSRLSLAKSFTLDMEGVEYHMQFTGVDCVTNV